MPAITLGVIESAVVAFGGAFLGSYAQVQTFLPALVTGGIAAFAVLGYSGYTAATAKPAA